MKAIQDLQKLAVTDFDEWKQFGNVRVVRNGDLALFNYTPAAQFERRWNWLERISRGLILNAVTGEIVARPFDKFFNWLENGEKADGHIITVTEKFDGSLGILYRDDGTCKIATRGSFCGEQALWATDFLQTHYDLSDLENELTLLFEIIYPDNRIVVDYGTTEDLILLAARNRFTGEYLPFFPDMLTLAHEHNFTLPKVHNFNDVTSIIAAADTLDGNREGWVVEFSDGSRFKFKGDRYCELHRLVTQASFKSVLQAVAQNKFDSMIADVPDEFLGQIREWKAEIDRIVDNIITRVEDAFAIAPKTTRKEFAYWAQSQYSDIAPYLFKKLDGRSYLSLIYQREFR